MTIIVDSKTVTSCICPECHKEVEISGEFGYYSKFKDVYCKIYLQEVECNHCFHNFYASENGLDRVPKEFLSESDREKNDFTGKMVKFHDYQDVKEDDEVVFTFSPTGTYKCISDINWSVNILFPSNGKSHPFSKSLVYLSEEK